MAGNSVAWFEIYVQEMERAKAFYEGVFGVKLDQLNSPGLEMWSFPADMQSYGIGGALVRMPGVPSGGNSTIIYFSCQDCAVEQAKVEAAGGRVKQPKMSIGEHGFIALAFDTEGNMIGLHSMR